LDCPALALPERASVNTAMLEAPLPQEEALAEELVKGPNIASLPDFPEPPARIEAPVLLKVGDGHVAARPDNHAAAPRRCGGGGHDYL
jgi:aconitate hydratase